MEQHPSPADLYSSVAHLNALLSNSKSAEGEKQKAIEEVRVRITEVLRRVSTQLRGVEESGMTKRQKITNGTRRAALRVLALLNDLAPFRSYPDPQILQFDVLPEGVGPEVTEGDGESPDAGVDQDRVHWTIDVLRRMDPTYRAEGNFFRSESARDGGGTGYHVLLFPVYGRAVFVSNVHGNATYVCPHEDWAVFAKMTRGELLECAGDWERNPRDPHALEVTRLTKPHMQELRLVEEIWKERLCIELERNAGVLPQGRRNTVEDTLERVRVFGGRYRRLPKCGSSDPYEDALWSLLMNLRKSSLQENGLTPDQNGRLRGMARETHFANLIGDLVSFLISYDRLPEYGASSEEERKLDSRLQLWAALWRDGALTEEQGERLRALGVQMPRVVPRVFHAGRADSYIKVLEEFVFENERPPCCKTKTGTPERIAWNKMTSLRKAWIKNNLTREQAERILRMGVPLVEGEEADVTLAKLRASGPSNEGGEPKHVDDAVEEG